MLDYILEQFTSHKASFEFIEMHAEVFSFCVQLWIGIWFFSKSRLSYIFNIQFHCSWMGLSAL